MSGSLVDFTIVGFLKINEQYDNYTTIAVSTGRRRGFVDWMVGDPLPLRTKRFSTAKAAQQYRDKCCTNTLGLTWGYHVVPISKPKA